MMMTSLAAGVAVCVSGGDAAIESFAGVQPDSATAVAVSSVSSSAAARLANGSPRCSGFPVFCHIGRFCLAIVVLTQPQHIEPLEQCQGLIQLIIGGE